MFPKRLFLKKHLLFIPFALLFSSTSSFAESCSSLYEEQAYRSAIIQCLEEASLNTPHAFFILGQLYENGHGAKQNTNKAIAYYRQAVLNNDVDAQLALGKYHAEQKSYLRSHIFFSLATDNGSLGALKHKDKAEQNLSSRELELSSDYLDLVKNAIFQQRKQVVMNY